MLDRAHREFFWLLVRRDLRVRYAGSTLGGLWNLIHPLVMIAIYMTIFSTLMASRFEIAGRRGADYGTLAYGVHLVAGLLPWLLFSDVLTRSTGVLIENANLLRKVAFPPIVLFASVLFNGLFVYGAGYLAFLLILAALGFGVPLSALAGLGVMALAGIAAAGLGLILAGLNVFFRDVGQFLQVAMQILFWFNPIVYEKSMLFAPHDGGGEALAALRAAGRWLIVLNPFERFVNAVQALFGVTSMPPSAFDWLLVLVFPALCLAAGTWLFRRTLPEIRDCL